MTDGVRTAYLEAAGLVPALLRDPAVAAAWDQASALEQFSVGGLAGHLARQAIRTPGVLADRARAGEPISLLDHYVQSGWVGADLDSEDNVRIRDEGQREAVEGPEPLANRVDEAIQELRQVLPAEPADRVVFLPWGPWSLTLDDFLVTRMMEIAVHSDDLAVSVGIETPPLPDSVLERVLDLLLRVAVHRRGAIPVLRALSRSERAPATVSAF